jgi:hypothetical protein
MGWRHMPRGIGGGRLPSQMLELFSMADDNASAAVVTKWEQPEF